MSDPHCIFCKIIAGEIPAFRVFEDDTTLAFLDVGPLAEGHLLVIPKTHYERLDQMDPDALTKLTGHLPRLGLALMQVTSAQAYNLLQNNGNEAGQVVMHVHFHLIPRKPSDGLGYRWLASSYAEGRGEVIAQEFKATLDSLAP